MNLQFYKMSGAGNDFVVVDNRDLNIPSGKREEWIEKVCRRGLSIARWFGADRLQSVGCYASGNQ